ncbi:FxsB family cyclophane-forming radical SAM/SPASM peptide maturase [Nocardiopsis flavescens]|uniref:FxsB family cyclophane-forming radical SAM/SPASM peptide maturase n=1 Tax=Nocardiopsis flavescens TaxID=758803 RepID=UPI001C49CC14|nr:FxsB family cyclophane-forming radical SAM/SPASM peptide maturase [Nocardiopsis flavescens]
MPATPILVRSRRLHAERNRRRTPPPHPVGPPGPGVPHHFVVKVHSRCNLACHYCYVYRSPDTSWRTRPRALSSPVTHHLSRRLVEHGERHRLSDIAVTLHGGEPLLVGHRRLDAIAGTLRRAFHRSPTALHLSVQTNGVLLDTAFLEILARHRVAVGVSLDGDAEAHDRYRRHASGRGSHRQVGEALALLNRPRFRGLYGGLLCRVDLANDPVRTYEALRAHAPPMVDFLLPHATWDRPPPGTSPARAPYADWLIEAFDHWHARAQRPRVRTFDSLVRLVQGEASLTEDLGEPPSPVLVVETDGAIELHDSLKIAYEGAGATGLNVSEHGFDRVRPTGDSPCSTCVDCPLFGVCGGGMRAHRHRADSGFANPSVYCRDLQKLIRHVDRRVGSNSTPARPTEH